LASERFHFDPFNYETSFSIGEAETSPLVEMDEIDSLHTALFNIPFLDKPFDAATAGLDDFEKATALRVRFAYTMLFQQASVGKSGGSGDLDIMSAWTLLGRGTANTGRLIVTGEYRHKMGDISANALRDQIGSLQRTTGGFNDRGWVLRDFNWIQRLYEGKLRFLAGRSDISDYFGAHRLQSINNSFSNRQFSANSTTAFPNGHAISGGVSVQPIDDLYVTGGAANAYGQSNINDMSVLDEGDLFWAGEVGYTPTFEGLGPGRYALFVWHMDARTLNDLPSDTGFSIIAEQNLNYALHIFGRYGWSEDGTTGIKQAAEMGLGLRGLLGSPDNLTGAAIGISEPTADGLRDEIVTEIFHRFQLTPYTQLSFGLQGIFDPSNAPTEDAIAVFTTRFRVEF
jgi:porin